MKCSDKTLSETELRWACSRGAVNVYHSLCLFPDIVAGICWESIKGMSLDAGAVSSTKPHMGMNTNVMLSQPYDRFYLVMETCFLK